MVQIDNIEVDVSETCNLRCLHCTHSAPYFTTADNYELREFEIDISILAEKVHFGVIRLIGGEPLLNKDLGKYVDFIRKTQVADKIAIFTNGLLLHKTPLTVFNHIDHLRVSLYPLDPVKTALIKRSVTDIRKQFPALSVVVNPINFFSTFNLVIENADRELVKKIHDKCYYRKDGLNLYNGKIYKCFAARKKFTFLKNTTSAVTGDFQPLERSEADVLPLEPFLTEEEIRNFLADNKPLEACKWCLGTNGGRKVPHSQIGKWPVDHATLADLDFEAGEKYMSNLLLSWNLDKMHLIEDDEWYKPEHVHSYFDHFGVQPF